jgi:hypothetical protein
MLVLLFVPLPFRLYRCQHSLHTRSRDVLLFDRTDQPFSIAVLCGLTHRRHADLATNGPQEGHIAVVGVLDTLIGGMELRRVPLEGSLQGCEGQVPIRVA